MDDSVSIVETPSFSYSIVNLLLVVLLVFANAFFVASEFALVAVRRSRIETLANSGNRSAQRLLEILSRLNEYVSATQLGITLASLGLGWIGEPAVARLLEYPLLILAENSGWYFLSSPAILHTISFTIAFSIITFLHIVFGELAPKTIALETAEKTALIIARPMQIFYKLFYYPIKILDWTGTKTVRLLGFQAAGEHGSSYTEEEIRNLIRASSERGLLNEEEGNLIDKIFEFSDTTVKEAMIPRTEIAAIPDNLSLEEIVKAFQQHGYSRLPVYRNSIDDIIGFIHSKDILPYMLRPKAFRLEKVLQKPMYVVDTAKLEDVLRQMQKEKFHFGFVVDEHGGIEGIITLEDLLEEIVGDISDEHDEEVNEKIVLQPDGSYILEGTLAVRDLNRRLGAKLPISEAYTTIAGFLMNEAGRVLQKGDAIKFGNYLFEIEEVDRHRIVKVRMRKLSDMNTEKLLDKVNLVELKST
ncbi:MAG: hemolysin family protein [Pyrinomonadaceae bacterium]|nr:hemolysin family protein [Pyrinomonadaceae bacterium]MCX7640105.1 hemolysin family protein [Pyrinomonadaceae bacterium]